MTRQEAAKYLVTLGIAEPSEEQITNYLDMLSGQLKAESSKAERYKADAQKAAELEKQLEELQNNGLSEVEKLKKDLEASQKRNSELLKDNVRAEVKAILNGAGLSEEQYSKFIDGFVSEDMEASKGRASAFVETVSGIRTSAEEKFKENLMDNTKGLGGENPKPDTKTEAEKFAEAYAANKKAASKTASDILNIYTGGNEK